MKNFLKQKNNKNTGFTLVETLVAISIFTVSIISLMTILSNGIANTNYAKRKITAEYLAQEGIEYVHNMRDTYMLYSSDAQSGWNIFNTSITPCFSGNGCYFNPDQLFSYGVSMPVSDVPIIACSPTSVRQPCPPMAYDTPTSTGTGTGKYGYDTGVDSGFTRVITATQISADEIKVTSTIYWTQGSGDYNVSFSEDLFNWIE